MDLTKCKHLKRVAGQWYCYLNGEPALMCDGGEENCRPGRCECYDPGDKLDRIFELQAKFDLRVAREHGLTRVLGNNLPEDALATPEVATYVQDRWLQAEILAMFSELAEILDHTSFKWWKEPKALDREAVKEELVDLLHFFVSTCLKLGIDAGELYQAYCAKNKENHRRQDEVPGYKASNNGDLPYQIQITHAVAPREKAPSSCWFCNRNDGQMLFSYEFDCCVHKECVLRALEKDPNHPEARIMATEFGLALESGHVAIDSEATEQDLDIKVGGTD